MKRNVLTAALISGVVIFASCPIVIPVGSETDEEAAPSFYSLSGSVTDADGLPCAGAQVQLKSASGKTFPERYIAGEDGCFAIEKIESGVYGVDVSLTGFHSSALADLVLDGNAEQNIVLEAIGAGTQLYSFSGLVSTSDGGGAENAVLQLLQNNVNYGNAVFCGTDGNFSVAGIEAGTYAVFITCEGYDGARTENIAIPAGASTTFVIVRSSVSPEGLETAPLPKYKISGVISLVEGGYANGATAQLMKNGALYGANVVCGVGGAYTVYNVVPGDYVMRVTLPGFNTATINNVNVTSGNLSDINYSLAKTYNRGDIVPAGGCIVYAGGESMRKTYGWTYIELAPEDIMGDYENGTAIYGSYRPTLGYSSFRLAAENTEYIVGKHKENSSGDFVQKGLAAVLCDDYALNGQKGWVLPTSGLFEMIQSNCVYQNYNFKLNSQYWCSDAGEYIYTYSVPIYDPILGLFIIDYEERQETRVGISKFRFEPLLTDEVTGSDLTNFTYTNNSNAHYYVRPGRYF
jgi:hypothetical protein